MQTQIIKKLLLFMVCLVLVSCPSDSCAEFQDVVSVEIAANAGVDSLAVKVNDSIAGCGYRLFRILGSKTHRIKFPVNVQVQLFKNGEELKELSFKMLKNTELRFYAGDECLENSFLERLEIARKNITLIDFSLLNDEGYCWIIEKMYMGEDFRCMEYGVQGEVNPCNEYEYINDFDNIE